MQFQQLYRSVIEGAACIPGRNRPCQKCWPLIAQLQVTGALSEERFGRRSACITGLSLLLGTDLASLVLNCVIVWQFAVSIQNRRTNTAVTDNCVIIAVSFMSVRISQANHPQDSSRQYDIHGVTLMIAGHPSYRDGRLGLRPLDKRPNVFE